jgi:hypothetical protein
MNESEIYQELTRITFLATQDASDAIIEITTLANDVSGDEALCDAFVQASAAHFQGFLATDNWVTSSLITHLMEVTEPYPDLQKEFRIFTVSALGVLAEEDGYKLYSLLYDILHYVENNQALKDLVTDFCLDHFETLLVADEVLAYQLLKKIENISGHQFENIKGVGLEESAMFISPALDNAGIKGIAFRDVFGDESRMLSIDNMAVSACNFHQLVYDRFQPVDEVYMDIAIAPNSAGGPLYLKIIEFMNTANELFRDVRHLPPITPQLRKFLGFYAGKTVNPEARP